jgi:hypothetical protein
MAQTACGRRMTMARKKKELDNLSKDMIQCAKDGFGCHYGRWKATQPIVAVVKDDTLPDGWKLCEYCGKPFKGISPKRFCDVLCRNKAYYEKNRDKVLEVRKIFYQKSKERKAV